MKRSLSRGLLPLVSLFFVQNSWAYSVKTGADGYNIILNDFNKDGIPDALVAPADESGLWMHIGNSSKSFEDNVVHTNIGVLSGDLKTSRPLSAIESDFDGDGNLDLLMSFFPERQADSDASALSRVEMFAGKGNGKFVHKSTLGRFYSVSNPIRGQFNGDKYEDLLMAVDVAVLNSQILQILGSSSSYPQYSFLPIVPDKNKEIDPSVCEFYPEIPIEERLKREAGVRLKDFLVEFDNLEKADLDGDGIDEVIGLARNLRCYALGKEAKYESNLVILKLGKGQYDVQQVLSIERAPLSLTVLKSKEGRVSVAVGYAFKNYVSLYDYDPRFNELLDNNRIVESPGAPVQMSQLKNGDLAILSFRPGALLIHEPVDGMSYPTYNEQPKVSIKLCSEAGGFAESANGSFLALTSMQYWADENCRASDPNYGSLFFIER